MPLIDGVSRVHQHMIDIAFAAQEVRGRSASGGADRGISWGSYLLLALIIGVVILYVYTTYRNAQPFRIEASTTLPENAAVDRVTEGYVRAGWNVTPLSDGRVLFTRTTEPGLGTTIALAIFFILPALIYMLTSRKRQTAELSIVSAADRRTGIEINGNMTGYGGVNTAAQILRALPKR